MMEREEYESLIASSGWAAMKRYLMDYRAKITEGVMDGSVPDVMRSEAIYRAQNLKDLAEMDWATIAKFYGIPLDTKEPA